MKALCVTGPDRVGALAEVLEQARNHGIDLQSVVAFALDGRAMMLGVPKNFGLALQLVSMTTMPIEKVDAFRVEGDDERGALCGVMNRLAAAGIGATAVHAAATEGKFAGVLYVAPEDVEAAAEALGV